MNWLEIVQAGFQASLQDEGRKGYAQHGLARGGAMDIRARRWANKLLDNPADAATVELLLGGFRAICHGRVQLAITGADAPVTINRKPVAMWQTVTLQDGDELAIGHARNHRFICIAIAGGFDGPSLFGSRSVVIREAFGETSPLAPGNRLKALAQTPELPWRQAPEQARDYLTKPPTLRIIPGYQYRSFTRQDIVRLTTQEYQVSELSDRMGYRLEGRAMTATPPGIISEGLCPGAVQIPGDGQPIVLMTDCQTIGGYPKPGVVSRLDLAALAQQLPGGKVRFELADLATVQNERRLFELYFRNSRWAGNGRTLEWI